MTSNRGGLQTRPSITVKGLRPFCGLCLWANPKRSCTGNLTHKVANASTLLLLAILFGCSSGTKPVSGTSGGQNPVVNPPTASAGGPYAGTAQLPISFSGSASSDPQNQALTYSWNFGDSSTASGVTPTHTYAAAGTYTVKLTVTDTSNLSASASTTATVLRNPNSTHCKCRRPLCRNSTDTHQLFRQRLVRPPKSGLDL